MGEHSRFIAYQLTTQLCEESHLFELAEKDFCHLNFPPVNVLEFRRAKSHAQKTSRQNGISGASKF